MGELDFKKLKREKIDFLKRHHTIVLATSKDDKVTARTISYATEELDFYILSWSHHEKIMQVKKNPNVALARDNMSIKGVAKILGSPLDEKSRIGAEVIRKKRPKEFEIFSQIPGMIMIKVIPSYIKSWVRVDNKFLIEHLDLKNKRAYLQKPER
ncbi:MAG: pyridoxamine 5'-phosphate oxidase family protein [Candidatus Hodarchaeota archaeon]